MEWNTSTLKKNMQIFIVHRQRMELAFILYGDGDIQEIVQYMYIK